MTVDDQSTAEISVSHPFTMEEAVATLNSVYATEPREPSGDPDAPDGIVLHAGWHEGDLVAEVLDALAEANDPPRLFERGTTLSRVRANPGGGALIESLGSREARAETSRSVRFWNVRANEDDVKYVPAGVPAWLPGQLLASDRGERFPYLAGMITAPAILPDGHVVTTEGYDAHSKLWYQPTGIGPLNIPQRPSQEDVEAAVRLLLDDWLGEFPFASQADRANALAFAITCVSPYSFERRSPLFLIDANQPGTGKSYLVEVCHLVATGRTASTTPADSDKELEKVITTAVREGRTLLAFDNEDRPVKSPVLAHATTTTAWIGRVLGNSESIEANNQAVMSITGNNITVGGDMPRRVIWIGLHSDTYRAERRPFRRPDLDAWTLDHRDDLITAMLTLVTAWHAAGRPAPRTPHVLGSFQPWATTMGGVLDHAGIEGFLQNADAARDDAADEDRCWTDLLNVLERTLSADHTWFSTSDFVGAIEGILNSLGSAAPELPKDLAYALSYGDRQVATTRVGKLLKAISDRRFDITGIHLEAHMDRSTQTRRWRVVRDADGPSQR